MAAFRLRPKLLGLAMLGLVVGVGGAVVVAFSHLETFSPLVEIVLLVGAGWAWIGTGLFAWWRRPDNAFGRWMVMSGFAWFAQIFVYSNSSLIFSFGFLLSDLFPYVLIGAMVRFPTGRIETRIERLIMSIIGGVIVLLWTLFLFAEPSEVGLDGAPANLLMVADSPTVVTVLLVVANFAAVVLSLLLIQSFIGKYRQASQPAKRLIGPVLWTSTALLAMLGISSLLSIATLDGPQQVASLLSWLTFFAIPVAFLIGLARSKLIRGGALGRMLEQVANESDPVKMQAAVAEALGDPSVELAFWLPEPSRYVDVVGRPIDEPGPDCSRAASQVTAEGRKVALIIHDGALLEESEKIDAVSRGAALAFENARLEAEVLANVEEIRASRSRIVEAGDAARREIERNLHDGAQQNLVSLALKLQMARSRVDSDPREAIEIIDGASAELEQTLAELRELARGIHPAVLSDRGLDAALLALAHRAPLPVEVGAVPAGRLPEPVEAAAYYVVAESLTNVVRYAEASRAKVDISRDGGMVSIRIADDGVGGADPTQGSGLKGLSDRIAALDGSIAVESPVGQGTVVEVTIPCG